MNTKKIKPTRKLIIKNPKLQKIRDNFRTVIHLAALDEYDKLDELDDLYREKRRINKKELTSHYKRSCQLHQMKEYILTTFSDSICVCAIPRRLDGKEITGDRVRYTLITEFEECYVESYGARYRIQEQWFSLKYYEENHEMLEQHLKKMKMRLKKCPDRITTTLEIHIKRLNEIRQQKPDYFEEEEEEKEIIKIEKI